MCDVLDTLLGLDHRKHVIIEDANFTRRQQDMWVDVVIKVKVPQVEVQELYERLQAMRATRVAADPGLLSWPKRR